MKKLLVIALFFIACNKSDDAANPSTTTWYVNGQAIAGDSIKRMGDNLIAYNTTNQSNVMISFGGSLPSANGTDSIVAPNDITTDGRASITYYNGAGKAYNSFFSGAKITTTVSGGKLTVNIPQIQLKPITLPGSTDTQEISFSAKIVE